MSDIRLWRGDRNREVKDCPMAEFGIDPDPSAKPLHNASADRQSNSTAGILLSMKPFEWNKDLVVVMSADADSVVLYRENPLIRASGGRYRNTRRSSASVFQSIANQILKDLNEMHRISVKQIGRASCRERV